MDGSATTRFLDQPLLDELEHRWREQAAAILDNLRPGLTDAEMDRATVEIGVRLPLEARRWWGWHDGASDAHGNYGPGSRLGLGWEFFTLADAVRRSGFERRVFAEIDPERWSESWLPLCGFETSLVIDCGGPADAPVPVYSFFTQDHSDRVADSLGDLVSWFLAALDRGALTWLRSEGRWDLDRKKLPSELKIIGLT